MSTDQVLTELTACVIGHLLINHLLLRFSLIHKKWWAIVLFFSNQLIMIHFIPGRLLLDESWDAGCLLSWALEGCGGRAACRAYTSICIPVRSSSTQYWRFSLRQRSLVLLLDKRGSLWVWFLSTSIHAKRPSWFLFRALIHIAVSQCKWILIIRGSRAPLYRLPYAFGQVLARVRYLLAETIHRLLLQHVYLLRWLLMQHDVVFLKFNLNSEFDYLSKYNS